MIPVNTFSRPGKVRAETVGVVWHWTENPGQGAKGVERYFTSLAYQNPKDADYSSAHCVIGLEGEVLQLIPYEEVAYHVGSYRYTSRWTELYPQYANNKRRHGTPNWALIGIELCCIDAAGRFTRETYNAAVELGNRLMYDYTLGWCDNYRHYDITGKICPRWFVHNPEEWDKFKLRLKAAEELRA